MENLQFGPRYCETPDPIGGAFPIEPWNAISSLVICVFGLAGLLLVVRRAPRAWPLYVLCVLLVVNGAGSVLWHGLRTRWALTLDVQPAILFVLFAALLWARRVAPLWQAAPVVLALALLPVAVRFLPLEMPAGGRMALSGLVIVAAALWLILRTVRLSPAAALSGGTALALALGALTFRSIDHLACGHLDQGSHFLWHILLSSAAFTLVLTLIRLNDTGAPLGRPGSRPVRV